MDFCYALVLIISNQSMKNSDGIMVIIFSEKLQSVFRTVFQGNSRYTNYPLMNLSSWILLLTISRQQYTFTIKSGKISTSLLKRIIIRQFLRFPVGFSHFIIFWENEYDEMMKRTDFSLNTAKKRGRNRYYIFNEQDYQRFLHLKDISDVLHGGSHT